MAFRNLERRHGGARAIVCMCAGLAVAPASALAQAPNAASPAPAPQMSAADYAQRAGSPYANCDGYGEPTATGDGMTSYAAVLGVFRGSGDRRRGTPFFGRTGEIGCSLALADLEKRPKYWMRKVSLLRARAIHKLVQKDVAGATADLDAAEAAAAEPAEPYYQRSLRLQIQLTRAFVRRQSGDRAAAATLAAAVSQARPFSRQTALAALAAMGREADFASRGEVLRRLAQLDPGRSGQLFYETFEQGRFSEALELYGALQPPVKLGDDPMQYRDRILLEQDNRALAESFWADAAGRRAYALAALGRPQEARKALADAEARLAAATPPAPALPAKPRDEDVTRSAVFEQTNLKIRSTAPPILAQWARVTEARLLVADGKVAEATQRFRGDGKVPPTYASVDFIEAIAPLLPPAARPDPKVWRDDLRKARKESADDDLKALFAVSPEAETAQRIPRLHGYADAPSKTSSYLTVRYRGYSSTEAMVEEDALLHAADLAAQAGKDAFLIHALKDIEHTTITTQYGQPVGADPSGYESDIDVEFVDAGALPADRAAERWRLIPVSAVRSELAPRYRRDQAGAAGGKP